MPVASTLAYYLQAWLESKSVESPTFFKGWLLALSAWVAVTDSDEHFSLSRSQIN